MKAYTKGFALLIIGFCFSASAVFAAGPLRAGAHSVDITPTTFPIITSGGFLAATADRAVGTLHARAIALDNGERRVVVAVVDTLMMPRELLDRVKEAAARSTGIPPDKMMISATHSHSTPPVMGALGTDSNPEYARFLESKLLVAIEGAVRNLTPAKAGWTTVDDFDHTHCRQWILRPDRIRKDPFGELTVRSNMHPGYQHPDFIGPSGPVDPALTLLAFQSTDGRPLAMIANYSMHYVGAGPRIVSPDYYGPFVENMERLVGAQGGDKPFVAIISQGTAGDQHWMDYSQPKKEMNIQIFADALASIAHEAYKKIEYRSSVPLAMAEAKVTLRRRVASPERLAWAREVVAKMNGAPPKNQPEVYAREQLYIAAEPERELKLQALRIGDLGIATFPNEVFAITGLKIKAQSPLQPTFNIELANGAEGYIPPPEQHKLGGYTTWAARSAGLEVNAEPKMVNIVLNLLEEVSGKPRRKVVDSNAEYPKAVLSAKPVAYWRCNEFSGPTAFDASKNNHNAEYGDGIVFYLEGPVAEALSGKQINRAPHYAGGKMSASLGGLGRNYTAELWFWNGLPADFGPVLGHLFSRGDESVGISQKGGGTLFFSQGDRTLDGKTPITVRSWHHLAVVRTGNSVRVYLDGKQECAGEVRPLKNLPQKVMIGGRGDDNFNFAGKIDEVALYNRPLSGTEISKRLALVASALGR